MKNVLENSFKIKHGDQNGVIWKLLLCYEFSIFLKEEPNKSFSYIFSFYYIFSIIFREHY